MAVLDSMELRRVNAQSPLAVQSVQPRQQQPVAVEVLATKGPVAATSYIPGASSHSALLMSEALLDQIRITLEHTTPLVYQRIGRQKTKVACFHGASVVDRIMDHAYAADRSSALQLALKLYENGVFRALQPGGFVDARDRLYRFRDEAQVEHDNPPAPADPAQGTLESYDQGLEPSRMFSIARIVSHNEDWLNRSWTNAGDLSRTETDDVDGDESQ